MRNEQIIQMVDAGIRNEMSITQAGKYLDVLGDINMDDSRIYKKYQCMVRLFNYIRDKHDKLLVAERITARAQTKPPETR